MPRFAPAFLDRAAVMLGGRVPSLLRTGLLDGTREQAKFIAFGIGENHPCGVGCLPHIYAPCAQVKKPFELIDCRHPVGTKVKMQTVLESLVLWHWHHVDRGPRSIRRGDADHAVVFFDHLPAEDPAPEVGDHTWLDGVDRDGRYATGHAAILRESGADRGYDARECSDFVRASRADNQASSDSHRQLGGARGRVRSRAGGTRTHDPRIMSTYSCNAVLTRVFPART